ncbi:MAG: Uma2 family endonuclease [Chloroflexota bacterium]|nr:Uma2 family endonuclease [Chloroflexota bacterium]
MTAYAPVAAETGMTMEDFVRQYDNAPFEMINGHRRTLMPTMPGHNLLIKLLVSLLERFEGPAGIRVMFDTPFVLTDVTDWVKGSRSPAILVFAKERLDAYIAKNPDWLLKPLVIVPDLCVEIVSKNDDFADVMEKVESYFADGVQLVWVFEPKTRTVTVRTGGSSNAIILHEDDMLDGGAVVAGFRVRVGDVFAL